MAMLNQQHMQFVFRVDASISIGSGHVMRCLTLALFITNELNGKCYFICREHPGNLIALIREKGFEVFELPYSSQGNNVKFHKGVPHAAWLAAHWQDDAELCAKVVADVNPDWLVIDHYALHKEWTDRVACEHTKILVIDDLADRVHRADVLLDQSLGRIATDYKQLVPPECEVLVGTQYALLRPEFLDYRDYSIQRKQTSQGVCSLLINLGGVDKDNLTCRILQAIEQSDLPNSCRITVVMGATAPWVSQVKRLARTLPYDVEVAVNVSDMAARMSQADLAIGAAGSTSWERCCLGLPTLMLVLADNQTEIASHLERAGASSTLNALDLETSLISVLSTISADPKVLNAMSKAASALVDGKGVQRLVNSICC